MWNTNKAPVWRFSTVAILYMLVNKISGDSVDHRYDILLCIFPNQQPNKISQSVVASCTVDHVVPVSSFSFPSSVS